MPWPESFPRVPDEEWTRIPVDELAKGYDTVEHHGWYSNLDHTVAQLDGHLQQGAILLDYSGGTGILTDRLLKRVTDREIGILIVDSSPKFLRLALEKFRDDPRVAFRHVAFVREERRLLRVDEVLEPALARRGVDALVSTNAVHLYYDLVETARSWTRVMAPGARAFVQSGNIDHAERPEGEWIIDATVEAIHRASLELARAEDDLADLRPQLADAEYLQQHDRLRRKYFLPVRDLQEYVQALESGGFRIEAVEHRCVPASVDEWYQFLVVYHEGVLGWVGGAERVTGCAASADWVERRKALLRRSMDVVFSGGETFNCCWTYLTARPDRAESGDARSAV